MFIPCYRCGKRIDTENDSYINDTYNGVRCVEKCTLVAYQAEGHPPQIDIGNGRTTKGKAYHLIPKIVFETLADRYELGQERKGDKAWNALSEYQDVLENIPFIHERINHIIQHAMEFRQKLIEGKPFNTPSDKGGDAGAILWGGSFLACVAEILDKKRNTEDADS